MIPHIESKPRTAMLEDKWRVSKIAELEKGASSSQLHQVVSMRSWQQSARP